MTRKCPTPPMTCPSCGYIAAPAELQAQLRARRSFKCPGCGCELLPDSSVGMLVSLAAPGIAFALWWAAGLRGGWLALATIAAAPIVWWAVGVVLTVGWPPRLAPARQPPPIPGYNPILGPRPMTLGLLDPPPHRPPGPTSDPAPGPGSHGERRDGGVGAP